MAFTKFAPKTQADPLAGYPIYAFAPGNVDTGVVIHADFPYAAWMSWTTYTLTRNFPPFNVVGRTAIVPDPGSVNPYIVGNRTYAPKRAYTLLVVPEGTVGNTLPDGSTLAPSLAAIPESNRILRSATERWGISERAYVALPGYNQAGLHGPTNTQPPTVTQTNLNTGQSQGCSLNILPKRFQTPFDQMGNTNNNPALIMAGVFPGILPPVTGSHIYYPPKPDPRLVQFFRSSLAAAPAPDVPVWPATGPGHACTGYLNAKLNQNQIALIRIPRPPTPFDIHTVNPGMVTPNPDVSYYSFNTYGTALGSYLGARPRTMSINSTDVTLDPTGGLTIVVLPRVGPLSRAPITAAIIATARRNGWMVERGNVDGAQYADSMLVRFKGTNANYPYSFTANNATDGVPCFYDNPANANVPFSQVPASYAASPSETGPATPQGVECGLAGYLGGNCLSRLKAYISSTGGSYIAPPR
jgi:hypothetical protein